MVDKKAEEVRDAARKKLGCVHIERCPQKIGSGQTTSMVEYATEEHGMAFVFDGIALCHAQADFDVKKLSTWVWRWDGKFVSHHPSGLHIQPCLICSRKAK